MAEGKKAVLFALNDRNLSVVVFSLFSSWLLAVPFEGRILFSLLNFYQVSPQTIIFGSMAAHCAGLILCGFIVRNMRAAKKLMLFSIAFCIAASGVLFFPPSLFWKAVLFLSSFLAGLCVAAWGYFLKNGTPEGKRITTIADMLIFCYILTTLLGKAASDISPHAGLGLSILPLVIAFIFALRLPEKEQAQNLLTDKQQGNPISIAKPLTYLCLFIVVIAINAGLMFQVQYPAFAHLEWLTSWYWAVPYIIAVFVMRNLPLKTNRTYILYAAIAMTGFSFIAFIVLDRLAVAYLIVNTLMQGAFGVFNLFWWSILGEMLSFHKNAAKVLGAGLFANVLGILIGVLIGNVAMFGNGQSPNSTLLALSVVCITLVMLPPLNGHLSVLLKNHAYLTAFSEMPQQEQTYLIRDFGLEKKLTEREREIASLLIMGKTYRMIANELFVSENTVKTHTKNIYAKVGAHNRTELMSSLLDINPISTETYKSQ